MFEILEAVPDSLLPSAGSSIAKSVPLNRVIGSGSTEGPGLCNAEGFQRKSDASSGPQRTGRCCSGTTAVWRHANTIGSSSRDWRLRSPETFRVPAGVGTDALPRPQPLEALRSRCSPPLAAASRPAARRGAAAGVSVRLTPGRSLGPGPFTQSGGPRWFGPARRTQSMTTVLSSVSHFRVHADSRSVAAMSMHKIPRVLSKALRAAVCLLQCRHDSVTGYRTKVCQCPTPGCSETSK